MPARLVIEGGVPLRGRVSVSAAKNAALPALAASLLTAEPVTLPNLPELGDVRTMLRLLETHGGEVERDGRRATVRVPRVTNDVAPYELVSTMRASVLVLETAGGTQAPEVMSLMRTAGFTQVATRRDLPWVERFVAGRCG